LTLGKSVEMTMHGMTLFAPIFLILAGVDPAHAGWVSIEARADWGGRDFWCSPGAQPEHNVCNVNRRGYVATCWDDRNEGWPFPNCTGYRSWCTYKHITLTTPPDGKAPPGDVYVCTP
jgi:hypothetical protein